MSSFLSVCRIIFPPMFQFNKLLFQSVHRTCQTLPFLLHLTWRTMTLLSLRLQMFACNYAGNTSSACSGALALLGRDLSNQICLWGLNYCYYFSCRIYKAINTKLYFDYGSAVGTKYSCSPGRRYVRESLQKVSSVLVCSSQLLMSITINTVI